LIFNNQYLRAFGTSLIAIEDEDTLLLEFKSSPLDEL